MGLVGAYANTLKTRERICNKKEMVSREMCLQISNVNGANVQRMEINSWMSSLGKWNVSVLQDVSCPLTVQALLQIKKQIKQETYFMIGKYF